MGVLKADVAQLRTFSQRGEATEMCGVRGCGGTLHFYTEGGLTRQTCNRCEMRVLLIERLAKTFAIDDPTKFLQLGRPEFKKIIVPKRVEKIVEKVVYVRKEVPIEVTPRTVDLAAQPTRLASGRLRRLERSKTPGIAATFNYKPKPCAFCGETFQPISGRNAYCPDHANPATRHRVDA